MKSKQTLEHHQSSGFKYEASENLRTSTETTSLRK